MDGFGEIRKDGFMSELQVFSKDVIPVYITSDGKKVVIGRELHERLKIDTEYSKWFDRMADYGFSNEIDFSSFLAESTGGRPATNHILSLDMAKHIAMIQRTPEGKSIRDRLIQLDTNIESLSPELRLLIKIEVEQKQQAKALADTNKRIDSIGEVIALNPTAWRTEAHRLITKIALKIGGYEHLEAINTEINQLVDKRGGVSLSKRLENKRLRMAEEGYGKSKRDRVTKLDIIAEDKKLIEIYIAIVKELSIKYGVTL